MNWVLFMQFAGQLAGDIAASNGTNQRATKYLQLIAAGIGSVKQADSDLGLLVQKYKAEVAANKPVSVDELEAFDKAIAERSLSVQALRPNLKPSGRT